MPIARLLWVRVRIKVSVRVRVRIRIRVRVRVSGLRLDAWLIQISCVLHLLKT